IPDDVSQAVGKRRSARGVPESSATKPGPDPAWDRDLSPRRQIRYVGETARAWPVGLFQDRFSARGFSNPRAYRRDVPLDHAGYCRRTGDAFPLRVRFCHLALVLVVHLLLRLGDDAAVD